MDCDNFENEIDFWLVEISTKTFVDFQINPISNSDHRESITLTCPNDPANCWQWSTSSKNIENNQKTN